MVSAATPGAVKVAVKLYMPLPFDRFKDEGDIIGRMVIEYGDLEWDLCLLVSHVIEDLDIAVKTKARPTKF